MKLLTILLQPPWTGNGPPPWTPPGGNQCWPPPCISIEDNVFILCLCGLVLGYYLIKKEKNGKTI